MLAVVTGLVIDLSPVRFIDSSGPSVVVGLHHAARALDKDVALHQPSRLVARLLQVTALDSSCLSSPT